MNHEIQLCSVICYTEQVHRFLDKKILFYNLWTRILHYFLRLIYEKGVILTFLQQQ